MWGNIASRIGNVVERVKTFQNELEQQLDAAVGVEDGGITITPASPGSARATSSLSPSTEALEGTEVTEAASISPSIAASSSDKYDDINLESPQPKENAVKAAGINKKKSAAPPPLSGSTVSVDFSDNGASTKSVKAAADLENALAALRLAETKSATLTEDITKLKKEHQRALASAQDTAAKEKTKELKDLRDTLEKDHNLSLAKIKAMVSQLEKENTSLKSQCETLKKSAVGTSSASTTSPRKEDAIAIEQFQSSQSKLDADNQALKNDLEESSRLLQERVQELTASQAAFAELLKVHETLKTSQLETEKSGVSLEKALAEASRLNSQVAALEQQLRQKESKGKSAGKGVEKAEKNAARDSDKIADLAASLKAKEADLAAAGARLAEAELGKSDLIKLKEIVADRERALESASIKLAETHQQLESAGKRISDMQAEMKEKDATLRELAVSTIAESDAVRQAEQYLQQIKSMNEKMAAYEAEGQTLSKKQVELEKTVRKRTEELKTKDKEIAKLNESKAQLAKVIEEQQELLRKNESDVSMTHKSLSAMQAVSQASTDKLAKLEAEVATKSDEIASQKRALESSWAETAELKRGVAEMRAERDDLKRQIGEGTSKVIETESSARDIATREAILRATNKQLQDSMQRQMAETSAREERLRDEVSEMRKRWQDAVTSREALATEMGGATAPLLRQISSLQDALRTKTESWQTIESSLSERALRAESTQEITEHKRAMMEDQLNTAKQQLALFTTRLSESREALHAAEILLDRMRRDEVVSTENANGLEARLSLEAGQRLSLQASLRELELRHKMDLQEKQEALDTANRIHEAEQRRAKDDIEGLRSSLDAAEKKVQASGLATLSLGNVSKGDLSEGSGLASVKVPISMAELLPSKYRYISTIPLERTNAQQLSFYQYRRRNVLRGETKDGAADQEEGRGC